MVLTIILKQRSAPITLLRREVIVVGLAALLIITSCSAARIGTILDCDAYSDLTSWECSDNDDAQCQWSSRRVPRCTPKCHEASFYSECKVGGEYCFWDGNTQSCLDSCLGYQRLDCPIGCEWRYASCSLKCEVYSDSADCELAGCHYDYKFDRCSSPSSESPSGMTPAVQHIAFAAIAIGGVILLLTAGTLLLAKYRRLATTVARSPSSPMDPHDTPIIFPPT